MQAAFDVYLAERGVDAEFGEYLMKLAADKEQRECACLSFRRTLPFLLFAVV